LSAIADRSGFYSEYSNTTSKKQRMKIYFAGSIRGGREDAAIYSRIIKHLQHYGEVLTEHIGDPGLESTGEAAKNEAAIHDRDLSWLLEADIVIAEVSTPSLGVGYEIGRAVENQKMVLCLYHPQNGKKLSAMIAGSPDIINVQYEAYDDLEARIDAFFAIHFKELP
jgi:2'-deoxynucleoside 5'-phosphate N-hydrolase